MEKNEYATLVALRDYYLDCIRDNPDFNHDLAAKADLLKCCLEYEGFYDMVRRERLL